ncbi:pyridoxamine 5'-phosphate oxidase family protein [Streptomyces sp. NPDC001544]|uniref:pyridoxamine 5'-phosphate oxidase family protein n=1 Tax=Streptomyces sp. NPDC001544 TaxID=3364584 RepID=UPI0036BAA809
MKITEKPRDSARRRHDVLAKLRTGADVWVATSGADGLPCLVPLWFLWDGAALWLSTRITSPTGRDLRDTGRARLALGDTQDVVLVDAVVQTFTAQEVPAATADAFAQRWGWDPRADHPAYRYFRALPRAIQAWNGVHELKGRHVMRNGEWADPGP